MNRLESLLRDWLPVLSDDALEVAKAEIEKEIEQRYRRNEEQQQIEAAMRPY